MWYFTKKEILEHFGKDGKNVRWLDRAIKKWVVIERDGRYASRNDIEIRAIEKYKSRIKELEEKAEWWDSEKLQEAVENAKYWERLNNEKKDIIKRILNDMYNDAKKKWSTETAEDFATVMSEKYGFNPKDD